MAGQEIGNEQRTESDKPSEATENFDRSKIDTTTALEERVQLAKKSDESYTKEKRFSLGDGSFGIDGLDEAGPENVVGKVEKQTADAPSEMLKTTDQAEVAKTIKTPNGTEVHPFPDGSASVITPDGKVSYVDTNGKVFEQQPDGSTKEVQNSPISKRPDGGAVVIENPDGSRTETWGTDFVVTEYPGVEKRVTSYANGAVHTEVPGRRIIENDPNFDGKVELHDNGVVVRHTRDGKTEVEPSPGGPQPWAKEELKDGTGDVKYVNPERGEVLIVHPDGSYEHSFVKDKFGNSHKISYDARAGGAMVDEYREKYESDGGGYISRKKVMTVDGRQTEEDGSNHPNKKT